MHTTTTPFLGRGDPPLTPPAGNPRGGIATRDAWQVVVVSLRANVNLKAATVEDLVERRKVPRVRVAHHSPIHTRAARPLRPCPPPPHALHPLPKGGAS